MERHLGRSASLAAGLAIAALTIAACGSSPETTQAADAIDTAAEVQAVPTTATPTTAAPATTIAVPESKLVISPPETEPPPPVEEGGHRYGATLDEWAASEDASSSSEPVEPEWSDVPPISWDDLIPPGASGEDIWARFEARFESIKPGSPEANALYSEMEAEFDPEAVNNELGGQQVRLAGFVAPLTYEDDIVTEFLLVPYFGACIHVPPPPPNQTVMVTADEENGLTVEESWGPVWVEGTLVVEPGTAEIGASSYRITNVATRVYTRP